MKNSGYVYVARQLNAEIETYKVGFSLSVENRLLGLDYTESNFKLELKEKFHDCKKGEDTLKKCLQGFRVLKNKELFATSLSVIKEILKDIVKTDRETFGEHEPQIPEMKTQFVEVENKFNGTFTAGKGKPNFKVFLHQHDAKKVLDEKILHPNAVSGLLVIPTGGGKTYTAVSWLLEKWISQGKKVLWLAHRYELLEQAYTTLEKNCYDSLLGSKKEVKSLIVSGKHSSINDIRGQHDIVFGSVQSLHTNTKALIEQFIRASETKDFLLVVDEAHHAAAKSYRDIIFDLQAELPNLKLLGLTATPFRSSDFKAKGRKKKDKEIKKAQIEEGIIESDLGKIFKDNILFSVSLTDLINQGILSEPTFLYETTKIDLSKALTEASIKKIQDLDITTAKDLMDLLKNSERNKLIVDCYLRDRKKFGKTLVFAVDKEHARILSETFKEANIKADYVVSDDRNTVEKRPDRPEIIESFRKNELEVLVNVNILTEGTDLPDLQTVFLARPTTSKILMMQMVGRALRGKKAGGTEKSFIVDFVDETENKIHFVNAESLLINENTNFEDFDSPATRKAIIELISLAKYREFVKILNNAYDAQEIMQLPFLSRVPVGTYHIRFTNPNEDDIIEENILVFDHLKDAYDNFLKFLPELIENEKAAEDGYNLEVVCNEVTEEYVPQMEGKLGFEPYFFEYFVRHFDYNNSVPRFIPFTDREKFDIDNIAQELYERNVGTKSVNAELDAIWDKFEEEICAFFHHNSTIFKSETYTALKNISLKDEISNSTIHTPPTISYETSIIRKRMEQRKAEKLVNDAKERLIFSEPSEEEDKKMESFIYFPETAEGKEIERFAYYLCGETKGFVFAKKDEEVLTFLINYTDGDSEDFSILAPKEGLYFLLSAHDDMKTGDVVAEVIEKNKDDDGENILIFGIYKNNIVHAWLNKGNFNVFYEEEEFTATGAAYKACSEINPELKTKPNGLNFWKYIDWKKEVLIPIKELKM
jgi:superfamily II DNA or RNA helicase